MSGPRLLAPRRWIHSRRTRLAHAAAGRFVQPHPAPVVVLGHQRSGTTAVAALLGVATGLPPALDLYREIHTPTWPGVVLGRTPFEDLVQRNRYALSHPIVKEPNLTFMAGHVLERWPSSPVVLVLRDPRDVVRSVFDRTGLPPEAAFEDLRRPGVPPGWDLVVDCRWMGIEASTPAEALAARWVRAARVATDHRDRIVTVRYADLVADPAGTVLVLAERLGLPTVAGAGGRVAAASHRRFQPPGRPDVPWSERIGRRGLEAVERVTAPLLGPVERGATS